MRYSFKDGSEVHKTYPANNLCIYCMRDGATIRSAGEGKLEREHIIPFALYGTLVFLRATCKPRANRYNYGFESSFIKQFHTTRAHLGFRSRKNKKRKRDITAYSRDGRTEFDVSHSQHPVSCAMPVMAYPPRLLDPARTGEMVEGITINGIALTLSGTPFGNRDGEPILYGEQLDMSEWTRALAKIAHSFAFAEYEGTFHPLLIEVIEGNDRQVDQFIGCASVRPKQIFPPHSLGIREQSGYLVVTIGLFSEVRNSSLYDVVVGTIQKNG